MQPIQRRQTLGSMSSSQLNVRDHRRSSVGRNSVGGGKLPLGGLPMRAKIEGARRSIGTKENNMV